MAEKKPTTQYVTVGDLARHLHSSTTKRLVVRCSGLFGAISEWQETADDVLLSLAATSVLALSVRRVAYTATIVGDGYAVSLVSQGVAGHLPVQPAQDYAAAKAAAAELNEGLGITERQALAIVTTTMHLDLSSTLHDDLVSLLARLQAKKDEILVAFDAEPGDDLTDMFEQVEPLLDRLKALTQKP